MHSGGLIMKLFGILIVAALALGARTTVFADEPPAAGAGMAGPSLAQIQHREQVRMDCINNRRMICGRILKVLPEGLLVDSGYADLMRPPLNKSWLVPGTVQTTRNPNLVEGREAEAICVGPIFLVDLPKGHGPGPKPKQYDYVILLGYPAGNHTYHSVGDVFKTVRQYSATLAKAVNRDLADEAAAAGVPAAGTK